MITDTLIAEIVNEAVFGLDPGYPIQPGVVRIRSTLAKVDRTTLQAVTSYLRRVASGEVNHPGIEVEAHEGFVLVRKAGA